MSSRRKLFGGSASGSSYLARIGPAAAAARNSAGGDSIDALRALKVLPTSGALRALFVRWRGHAARRTVEVQLLVVCCDFWCGRKLTVLSRISALRPDEH